MKTLRIAVVPVVIGLGFSAALGTGPASAAAASAAGWHVVAQLPVKNEYTSAVAAAGPSAEWAFTASEDLMKPGTAWENSGDGWHQTQFAGGQTEWVDFATALSPRDVWAFTQDDLNSTGRAWHWNGSSWSVARSFAAGVTGAAVLSDSDIWVTVQRGGRNGFQQTWHFTGSQWTQIPSGDLTVASASSPGNVWAYAGADVATWTGNGWKRVSLNRFLPPRNPLNEPEIDQVLALSPGNVYALAESNGQDDVGTWSLLHYNGHAWSRMTGELTGSAGDMTADGRGGLWITAMPTYPGQTVLDHYANGGVASVALPAKTSVFQVTRVPGTDQFLGAGSYDFDRPVILQP
jgi:hypothetical protein